MSFILNTQNSGKMGNNRFYSFFSKLLIDREDKNSFDIEVTDRNVSRLYFASIVVILLAVLHVIIFVFGLEDSTGKEMTWRKMIILAHSVLFFIALTIFVVTGIFRKKKELEKKYGNIAVLGTFVVFMLIGIFISGIDQLVNAGILPYIIICVVLPLVLLIPVFFSVITYFLSFLLFFLVINTLQPDKDVALSLVMNGMTSTALGILLSVLMWQKHVKQFRQSKMIERQTEILEKQNRQLEIVAEGLRQANETKDKFFSIISHDLRSPFNSIAGFSELIVHSLEEKNYEEASEFAGIIRQSTYRAMDLLSNLTEWSRSQTGKLIFKPEWVKLWNLVRGILELYGLTSEKKEIRMVNQVDAECTLWADRGMISTILRNLVSNAIKFTPRGGMITVKSERVDGEYIINVIDTGVGISGEMQDKLFLTGKNYSTAGTENEHGTGLGLILCREFVEKHGGKIGVESSPDKGSRFYFTIPGKN